MSTTNREELFDKMRNVWWFSGESPQFVYGNYRMNEVTAAVGLAQLEKIDGILAIYNKTLAILNEAIAGCEWLTPRHVPEQAEMVGYWWSCAWEGDKHGLSYEKFQKLSEELRSGCGSASTIFRRRISPSSANRRPTAPIPIARSAARSTRPRATFATPGARRRCART